jgi:F0F1-type ATP synthase membrane subunit b/b'
VTFGEMTEYYEKKIEELRDEFQREKDKLEQQYIDKVEQIRHELEVEAEENLKRQLQLMQD